MADVCKVSEVGVVILHCNLLSLLQFILHVPEVNHVIHLSSHLGTIIKGNGHFIIEVLQHGTNFLLMFVEIFL